MVNNISVIGGATDFVVSALPTGSPTRPDGQNLHTQTPRAGPVKGVAGEFVGGHDSQRAKYALAQSKLDTRNQLALLTRDQSDRLVKLEAGLAAMKDGLQAIVKHYPPYPPDNPERIELLNQVSGLKKEIEALDISRGGDIDTVVVAADKKAADAVPAFGDLSVLDKLPGDVITDEDLAQLLRQVESSQAKVAEARQKMWADLQDLVGNESDAQAFARSGESGSALAQGKLPITQAKGILATLL